MIDKSSFVHIMNGVRDYNDKLNKFEDTLDICMGQNFMTDIADIALDALVMDMEDGLEINNDTGSWIYYFAYELDFGRSHKAESAVKLDGVVTWQLKTAEQLYDLLVELKEGNNAEMRDSSDDVAYEDSIFDAVKVPRDQWEDAVRFM